MVSKVERKIFFICSRDPRSTSYKDGGTVVTKNNYNVLSRFGQVDVFSILSEERPYLRKILRLFLLLFGFSGGAHFLTVRRVLSCIQRESYSLVFIDHSLYGQLATRIKRKYPGLIIISHFHNIECEYQKKSVTGSQLIGFLLGLAAYYNEKCAVRSSDKLICLSLEDSQKLKAFYGRSADLVIPICMDEVQLNINTAEIVESSRYLLFCGSKFKPNIEGINWFILNVLPFIPFRLRVVGQGILRNHFFDHSKVEVFHSVEDLSELYINAVAVVSPIFVEGGMKTKVIDAMRYGKTILASSISLSGIKWHAVKGIYCCNSATDFISAIKQLDTTQGGSPNTDVLEYFKENFSTSHKVKMYREIFDSGRL